MITKAGFVERLNNRVAASIVGRWFCLEGCGKPNERRGSRFSTEIRAGLTTWAAMAYILALNASIISDSGGTCECTIGDGCANDPTYLACVNAVKRELITSTAAISALASFLMGLLANLPVGLAPGMGVNAFFAYSVVGYHGSGMLSYREALGAIFMEGWIFLLISVFGSGLRQRLVQIMPQSLIAGMSAGIGLFITIVGLSSGGINVIGGNITTYVSLGGCNPEDYMPGLVGYCNGGELQSPTMWLGIVTGGLFTVLLMLFRVRGAILLGIFLTAVISWPRGTTVTYFPHNATGDEMFSFFRQIVSFHKLDKISNVLEYHYTKGRVWYTLIMFLYIDMLGATGSLYSMAKFADLRDPNTLDFEHSTIAYCVEAVCISLGALMGTSSVAVFLESGTGISEGGRTGLAGITTGIAFLISTFFAPIFASIPPWATGGALVIVGSLMIRNVTEINWNYIGDAIPAFLTLIFIPLTYNISYGIIVGILSYVVINGVAFLVTACSNGKILPEGYEKRERLTVSGVLPASIVRLFKSKPHVNTHARPTVFELRLSSPRTDRESKIQETELDFRQSPSRMCN